LAEISPSRMAPALNPPSAASVDANAKHNKRDLAKPEAVPNPIPTAMLPPPDVEVNKPVAGPPKSADGATPLPPLTTTVADGASPSVSPEVPKPRATDGPIAMPLPLSNRNDGEIRDSIGVSARPIQDVEEKTPYYFQHVDFLRQHNDLILADDYLRQIITRGNVLSQYRSRAILELADCLEAGKNHAESLCWLKIWMQLYAARPEFGAVAYRMGTLYRQMGLPDLARDAFYLALAHTVNQGEVKSEEDLKQYTRLTEGILWALAANEYQNGQWARAAELFQRYRQEATSTTAHSQEEAAFLQADCYYQLRNTPAATALYEETLKDHPFNPLAPQSRLRLYHLYIVQNAPLKAQAELEALVWTVRSVWPKDEAYWQKQTAELLLAINQKNVVVLPPLLQESALLPPEGKTWQEALDHYDTLVGYQAATMHSNMDKILGSSAKPSDSGVLAEERELLAMDRQMNQVLPLAQPISNP
jgi:tetratricopeptide (TPR) repeat protein